MASEISAAAIEWGAKAENRKRPAVAVCWPRRDHRSLFGACEELVGGFASDLNGVVTQHPDLQLEERFSEILRDLGKLDFSWFSSSKTAKPIGLTAIFSHVSVAFGFRSGKVTVIKVSFRPSGLFLDLRVRLTPLPYSVIHNTPDGFRKRKGS